MLTASTTGSACVEGELRFWRCLTFTPSEQILESAHGLTHQLEGQPSSSSHGRSELAFGRHIRSAKSVMVCPSSEISAIPLMVDVPYTPSSVSKKLTNVMETVFSPVGSQTPWSKLSRLPTEVSSIAPLAKKVVMLKEFDGSSTLLSKIHVPTTGCEPSRCRQS